MELKAETTKTNTDYTAQRRIILNSKNSTAIKDAMREISKELMQKNEKLYRRLANQ